MFLMDKLVAIFMVENTNSKLSQFISSPISIAKFKEK